MFSLEQQCWHVIAERNLFYCVNLWLMDFVPSSKCICIYLHTKIRDKRPHHTVQTENTQIRAWLRKMKLRWTQKKNGYSHTIKMTDTDTAEYNCRQLRSAHKSNLNSKDEKLLLPFRFNFVCWQTNKSNFKFRNPFGNTHRNWGVTHTSEHANRIENVKSELSGRLN